MRLGSERDGITVIASRHNIKDANRQDKTRWKYSTVSSTRVVFDNQVDSRPRRHRELGLKGQLWYRSQTSGHCHPQWVH